MALYAEDRHKRAARMLGYTLLSASTKAWHGLALVLHARLTLAERGKLAFAVLSGMGPGPREMAFHAAHHGRIAKPEPSPFDAPEWRAVCAEYHQRRSQQGVAA